MKILSILLAAAMLIMAAGCSADGTPSVNDPEPAEKDTEPVGEEIPAEPQIPKYTSEDVELDLPEGSVNLTICRDFYGEIYLVESKNRVIKLSDNELIVAVGDPELNGMTRQYLVNTDDLSATSLLPEELSGHTPDEFYNSITGKTTTLSWCDGCILNGKRGNVEKPTLAYYSNKFCDGDIITDSSNCYDLGAIWLFDLSSSAETRIAPPEGYEVMANGFKWLNDSALQFTACDPEGNEFYFIYDINTSETEMLELDGNALRELIGRDADFYNLTHYAGNLDPDELLIHETDGVFMQLKNDPFNGDFSAFLAEEDKIYTEDFRERAVESDGKIYVSPLGGSLENEYRLEGTTIRSCSPEEGRIDMIARFAPNDGDKLTLHTRLVCWYTVMKTQDGWRIAYADRNMIPYFDDLSYDIQTPQFLCVNDDPFGEFAEKPDISTDEIINLLMNRRFIIQNERSSLNVGAPGVEFNLSDPENYIERMSPDGNVYPFYAVSDTVFADAESWYGLIDATFTGEPADKYRGFEYYADIDGKLYTTGFAGGTAVRQNAVWQVTEASADSFTVKLLTGGSGEIDTAFYVQEIGFKKTGPDGTSWRIESENFSEIRGE